MKLLGILILIATSASAMATECSIKTIAKTRAYPLAWDKQTVVEQVQVKEDCIELAKEQLGTTYAGKLYLTADGYLNVTWKVKKVRWQFPEDGILYTGSIK